MGRWGFVFLAYGIVWGALLLYLFSLKRRFRRAETELTQLRSAEESLVKGSLQKDAKNLTYRFELTDGTASIPVFFRGVPPDLFADGKGAVVEGRIGGDGVFQATTIMAKHSEEYSPPPDSKVAYPHSFVPGKEPQSK